ncbi:helix-turn-helix transcriptional regulator [Paraburkholderia sp. A1RO-5]|uniref:helix-turn-helix domain-containing protein n=1 Tax=Paraburkholderia sp. A1RO-5 TaxID=3028369 RepID=UPI003B7EE4F7
MKSAEQYLDEVRERLDLPSDYAISKALSVTRAAVSKYRCGRTLPDDLVCARIADLIGCEPMEVIAAMHYQRANSDEERALWEGIWGKAAGAFVLSLPASKAGASEAPTSKARGSGNADKTAEVAPVYIM